MGSGLIRIVPWNADKGGFPAQQTSVSSNIAVNGEMDRFFSELRVKVLLLRIVLGVAFAFLLTRFFFPGASLVTTFALGGLLTFAAYVLELFRRGRRP